MPTIITLEGYQHIGCYADSANRVLDGALWQGSITGELCASYCNGGISSGRFYPLIGLEDGNQCFCGSAYAHSPDTLNKDTCTSTCAGDSSSYCGGSGYIDVFSATTLPTGLTTSSTSSTTLASLRPSTVTITKATSLVPTSCTSVALPHQKSNTVIPVSVVAGVLALALLLICGSWLIRRRRRKPVPETELLGFQDQHKVEYPVKAANDNLIPELVDTGVQRL